MERTERWNNEASKMASERRVAVRAHSIIGIILENLLDFNLQVISLHFCVLTYLSGT